MTAEFARIEEEVHSLSAREKASLLRALIKDLDQADDKASEMLWVEEVERRYQSYQEGKIKAVPGDEAMQRARQRLK